MEKYDPGRPCPKCGCEDVSTDFRMASGSGSRMERRCARCGYKWAEKPLDEKEV